MNKEETKSPDPKDCQHHDLEFDNGGQCLSCTDCGMRYVNQSQHMPYFNIRILAKERRSNPNAPLRNK